MIEVTFSPSTSGNLKAANAWYGLFKESNYTAIIQLEFMLDVGYIDNDITGEYRTNLPRELYMFRRFENIEYEDDDDDCGDSFGKYNNSQWGLFKKHVRDGLDVRVWVSPTAQSMCGFLRLCSFLEEKKNRVYAVEAPRYVPERSKNEFLRGWEMYEPQNLKKYIAGTRELDKEEIRIWSTQWKKLKRENASLRAFVSDRIISVNEDFYDFMIRKHIPEGRFKQCDVVEHFYDDEISVGTYWIERRIEHMIKAGELVIIQDSKDQYNRILERGMKCGLE